MYKHSILQIGSHLLLGSKAVMTVGEMYFDKAKLKINMDNVGRVGKDGSKKLLGLVKISFKIMIIITNIYNLF